MSRLKAYKERWADEPGETLRERSTRESAVNNAEEQLKSKGTEFVDGERRAIGAVADRIAQSTANIESAANALIQTMRSRLVDPGEIADQLVALKRQAKRNRAGIGELIPRQQDNEKRAENVVEYMENFYDKFPALRNPVDELPGFRTDLDREREIIEDQEKRRPRNTISETERRAKRFRKQLF